MITWMSLCLVTLPFYLWSPESFSPLHTVKAI
jgi:hypothetical protein